MENTWVVGPLVLSATIVGLVNFGKALGLTGRWLLGLALGLGLGFGVPYYLGFMVEPGLDTGWVDFFSAAVYGVSVGLSSVGMYEGVKTLGKVTVELDTPGDKIDREPQDRPTISDKPVAVDKDSKDPR